MGLFEDIKTMKTKDISQKYDLDSKTASKLINQGRLGIELAEKVLTNAGFPVTVENLKKLQKVVKLKDHTSKHKKYNEMCEKINTFRVSTISEMLGVSQFEVNNFRKNGIAFEYYIQTKKTDACEKCEWRKGTVCFMSDSEFCRR